MNRVVERYENRKIKKVYYVNRNDKVCGKFVHYNIDGTKLYECYYAFDKRTGPYVEYEDNTVKIKCTYKMDLLEGDFYQYNKNGVCVLHCEFTAGVLHGKFQTETITCYYKNGVLDGKYIENSDKEYQFIYSDGRLHGAYVILDKNYRETGVFEEGQLHGVLEVVKKGSTETHIYVHNKRIALHVSYGKLVKSYYGNHYQEHYEGELIYERIVHDGETHYFNYNDIQKLKCDLS